MVTLSAPNRFIFEISEQSNIHITGLVLDSNNVGGAVIAQGFAPAQNIQIDNTEFRDVSWVATFPSNIAVVSTWGIINSTIQNNRFVNVAAGIWFTTVGNLNILNNSFTDVTQGDAIYIAPNPAGFPNGNNLKIIGNSGTNMARIAIELFRPDPSNGSVLIAPVIQNNSFSNWTGSGGMGLSITHGDGALISGNRISNVAGLYQTTAIEVIVSGAQITDNNLTGGFAEGIAIIGQTNSLIANNRISNMSDNGIILARDPGRGLLAGNNSTITGNTVVNAQFVGIKLDSDWSGSLVARNTITRTAGFWPQDASSWFSGIHQSPAPGIGVIDSNVVVQDATTWPWGFWFGGVRLNGSMPGSSVTNNVVRSMTTVPFGSGILDNTGSATVGWTISGNVNVGTYHDVN
jgi:parallel beta-helix repeat protein